MKYLSFTFTENLNRGVIYTLKFNAGFDCIQELYFRGKEEAEKYNIEALSESFDFWADNKVDKHFQLKGWNLLLYFSTWKNAQLANRKRGSAWWKYYYGEQLVRCFITDRAEENGGLQSVFEEKQFEVIYKIVRPIFEPINETA